jgi:lipoate-protein ligase A
MLPEPVMSLPTPLTIESGLQAEQDLLASVCAGDAEFGLLFWQPTDRALVMPRRLNRLAQFDHACEVSADAGWPVLLRETGGEPVPQSAATINIALVYAPPRSEGDLNRIETGYRRLCDPICQLLDELGGTSSVGEIDGAFCDGRFNVNLDGRKMVGTAQRWRQSQGGQRPVGLVHGAMLMDDEREAMVAAVNRFNEACGLEQRVRAQSHIALHEKFNAPQALARLDELFRLMLAQIYV